jgi:hypothetical protein
LQLPSFLNWWEGTSFKRNFKEESRSWKTFKHKSFENMIPVDCLAIHCGKEFLESNGSSSVTASCYCRYFNTYGCWYAIDSSVFWNCDGILTVIVMLYCLIILGDEDHRRWTLSNWNVCRVKLVNGHQDFDGFKEIHEIMESIGANS